MNADEPRTERFPVVMTIVTLASLGLFLALGFWMYNDVKPGPGGEDPRAKRQAVEARNAAVLEGKEPGTRPMAQAMAEFAAKQKDGTPVFPVEPAKQP